MKVNYELFLFRQFFPQKFQIFQKSYWEKKEEVGESDPCEGIDFIEILVRDEDIEYK